MARVRKVFTVCDRCDGQDDVRALTIGTGVTTRSVDLCAKHRVEVEAAHAAGRPPAAQRRQARLIGVA
jgi:hypothetical protein